MKPENKELLLQDLCARLPYGVKTQVYGWDEEKGEVEIPLKIYSINTDGYVYFETNDYDVNYLPVEDVRPFLRPMSSMTEEEARDIAILHGYYEIEILFVKVTEKYIDVTLDDGSICGTYTETIWFDEIISSLECFDYLNKSMFDFRGLIPKGLALSTETYNPYI